MCTLNRIFKIALIACFALIALWGYNILGPMPWKDSVSRQTNKRLEAKLEKAESINLSEFFNNNDADAHLLLLTPYFNAENIECPTYSSSFIKSLNIRPALHDGISRLVLIDSNGVSFEATINSRELFCYEQLEARCLPLNEAILHADTSPGKTCFRLGEKETETSSAIDNAASQ